MAGSYEAKQQRVVFDSLSFPKLRLPKGGRNVVSELNAESYYEVLFVAELSAVGSVSV
jgi:hypothetical protein